MKITIRLSARVFSKWLLVFWVIVISACASQITKPALRTEPYAVYFYANLCKVASLEITFERVSENTRMFLTTRNGDYVYLNTKIRIRKSTCEKGTAINSKLVFYKFYAENFYSYDDLFYQQDLGQLTRPVIALRKELFSQLNLFEPVTIEVDLHRGKLKILAVSNLIGQALAIMKGVSHNTGSFHIVNYTFKASGKLGQLPVYFYSNEVGHSSRLAYQLIEYLRKKEAELRYKIGPGSVLDKLTGRKWYSSEFDIPVAYLIARREARSRGLAVPSANELLTLANLIKVQGSKITMALKLTGRKDAYFWSSTAVESSVEQTTYRCRKLSGDLSTNSTVVLSNVHDEAYFLLTDEKNQL